MGYVRLAIGDGLLDIGLSFCFAPQNATWLHFIGAKTKHNHLIFIYFCSLQRRRIFVKKLTKIVLKKV